MGRRAAEFNVQAKRAKRAELRWSARSALPPKAREARPPSLGARSAPPQGSGVPWAVSAARAGARVKQGTNEQGCHETPEEFNGFSGDCGQTLLYPRLEYLNG